MSSGRKPATIAVRTSRIVTFSDGTEEEFTLEQWAEITAKCLIERCPECPRFTQKP